MFQLKYILTCITYIQLVLVYQSVYAQHWLSAPAELSRWHVEYWLKPPGCLAGIYHFIHLGHSDIVQFGVWKNCSIHFTSYVGCIVPVKAIFYPENCHFKFNCDSGDIDLQIIIVDSSVMASVTIDSECRNMCTVVGNVSTHDLQTGRIDVKFLAHFTPSLTECWPKRQQVLHCKDYIILKGMCRHSVTSTMSSVWYYNSVVWYWERKSVIYAVVVQVILPNASSPLHPFDVRELTFSRFFTTLNLLPSRVCKTQFAAMLSCVCMLSL